MATPKEQLDLFVAIVGDVPLRDDREAMSAPMVSIAKRSPREIEWTGPKGQHVVITCGDDADGIATIYDFDVVIWAISQVNAMIERGGKPSPTITFRPYDLLRAVNRGVSGRDYERFKEAVNRLRSTRIRTTIRRRHKDRLEDFNLLADFTLDEDAFGRPLGAQLTLPRWIYRAITEQRDVLAISPLYFDLSSGLDRFLYRLARRHAGNGRDNPYGWRFSFEDLHRRSGSQSSFKGFTRDLRRAIARNALPTYTLSEEAGSGGPVLRLMFKRSGIS